MRLRSAGGQVVNYSISTLPIQNSDAPKKRDEAQDQAVCCRRIQTITCRGLIHQRMCYS
jgi:hypothetical protein